jgi:hypothetical protein
MIDCNEGSYYTLGLRKATLHKILYFHALTGLVDKFVKLITKKLSKKVPPNKKIVYNLEFKFLWKWLNKYLNSNGAGWPKFEQVLNLKYLFLGRHFDHTA